MNRCRWVAAQGESLRRSRVWLYFPPSGDVAQLGERGVRNAEVEGSIPFVSTTLQAHCRYGGVLAESSRQLRIGIGRWLKQRRRSSEMPKLSDRHATAHQVRS
jgi:hypothetical protein